MNFCLFVMRAYVAQAGLKVMSSRTEPPASKTLLKGKMAYSGSHLQGITSPRRARRGHRSGRPTGSDTPVVRTQRGECCCSVLTLLLFSPGPTMRVGVPSFINLIWKTPHRLAQRLT